MTADIAKLGTDCLASLKSILGIEFEPEILKGEHFSIPSQATDLAWSGTLRIKPSGREPWHFDFDFEIWSATLAPATVSQQIHRAAQRQGVSMKPLLVMARQLSLPAATRFADAGVSFVDAAGNVNLSLGDWHKTILGRRLPGPQVRPERNSAAYFQMLFTVAARPETLTAPVRAAGPLMGLSKSQTAVVRGDLDRRGILIRTQQGCTLADRDRLERELVQGYESVLRPKLILGRYRALERDPVALLEMLRSRLGRAAPTGALAAYLQDKYYLGSEWSFFVPATGEEDLRALKLAPARGGEVTLLRGFGEVCFQGTVPNYPDPWLVYAEMLCSLDSRAQSAAADFRSRHIPWN